MNHYVIAAVIIIAACLVFYKLRSSLATDIPKIKQKLDEGALVVDVRTVSEFEMGHYPGAINIPVDQVGKRLDEFGSKEKPVVVYCASGGRSASAKSYLNSMGYQDVTNAGGLSDMPSY
ncbi:rhodanese-like domain-containing protein [Leptospira idonii]|uniref:Rhodanese-like domain-containing protein n=1 Tax=Leptospira idonii TaxID=1193500 RepID=A0A4R9LTM8_9LEPT|nr:rhodanese-like domain-containing protein [Leptospira idonii]TGN17085.1 rhodanese-like domain-containing protein [Leptospira idonii]